MYVRLAHSAVGRFCVAVALTVQALAQVPQRPVDIGVHADWQDNIHSASFSALPGIPSCCPRYTDGQGTGFELGALIRVPLRGSWSLQGSLNLSNLSALLSTRESVLIEQGSGVGTGVFEYQVQSTLRSLNATLSADYHPLDALHLCAGMACDLLVSTRFQQQEVIVEPNGGATFVDGSLHDTGSRIRNVYGGDIPGAATIMPSLRVGAQYDVRISRNGRWLLSPECSASWYVSPVAQSLSWNVHSVRLGLALLYRRPTQEHPPIIRESIDTLRREGPCDHAPIVLMGRPTTDTLTDRETNLTTEIHINRTDTLCTCITKKVYHLSGTLSFRSVDSSGAEHPVHSLRVEEFQSLLMTPLLNYIFFAPGSAELAERYRRLTPAELSDFRPEKVNDIRKLPTYYHVLNIVGYRMQQHPKAHLRLVGCTDDSPAERAQPGLAANRVAIVRDYLQQVWHIDSTRISQSVRALPLQASNTQTADGAEENRRVEIHADDDAILEPITTRDTLRYTQPPILRVHCTTDADTSVASQHLVLSVDREQPKEYELTTARDTSVDIPTAQLRVLPSTTMLTAHNTVGDVLGHSVNLSATLPVEYVSVAHKRRERIGDKEIDRFSLILFQVRSSALEEGNKRIMDFIASSVQAESQVSIVGYTDRLGDEQYNEELSRARAQEAASHLGRSHSVQTRGMGETNLYDNDLPEGRFYSRTVDIVVESPIRY